MEPLLNEPELARAFTATTPSNKGGLLWTRHRHSRFVDAVTQLGGVDKATPNEIVAVMKMNNYDDDCMTLEAVARYLRVAGPYLKLRFDAGLSRKSPYMWTMDRRRRFIDAVALLRGVDNATPEAVLKLMNDEDDNNLTVEEVARYFRSYYRPYFKRAAERLKRRWRSSLDQYSIAATVDENGYGPVTPKVLNLKRYEPYMKRLYQVGSRLDGEKQFGDGDMVANVTSQFQGFHILSNGSTSEQFPIVRPQSSSSSSSSSCVHGHEPMLEIDGYGPDHVKMLVNNPVLVAPHGLDSSSYNNVLSNFHDLSLTP